MISIPGPDPWICPRRPAILRATTGSGPAPIAVKHGDGWDRPRVRGGVTGTGPAPRSCSCLRPLHGREIHRWY